MTETPPLPQGPPSSDFLQKVRDYGGSETFLAKLSIPTASEESRTRRSTGGPNLRQSTVSGWPWRLPNRSEARRATGLGDHLAALSGADVSLLQEFPSERPRFVGLGGMFLTTGAFAGISSAFAVRMALHAPYVICAILGTAWALVIINLDRWLATSIQWQETWARRTTVVLPRLALALMLSFVISVPLQLSIFQREIDAQLLATHQYQAAQFEKNLQNADPRLRQIEQLKRQVAQYQTAIDHGGAGVAAVILQQNIALAEIDRLTRSVQQTRDSANLSIQQDDGILARLGALNELTSRNRDLSAANWLLTLVILAIETLPIVASFLQLLGRPTLYDRLVVVKEHYALAQAELRILQARELAEVTERLATEEAIREIEDFLAQQIESRLDQARSDVYSDVLMRP
ncbi:DUF4407 domain-containing protein [Frankia sp. Cj3]|uniref:DUF4407 domain-containing protein n=1 Tax=Frankia sp. Cj3 TaxID=2880976 RepID=UPI001EF58CAE|nr:DUF4407 domain-containing protein [Frankia sp. Cj3]